MYENKQYCPLNCDKICPDNIMCTKYGLKLSTENVINKNTRIEEKRFKRKPFCQMFNKDISNK